MSKKSKKGGYRPGSGRPRGTGKYKEKTHPIRIPHSLVSHVEALLAKKAVSADLGKFTNIYKTKKNTNTHIIPLYGTRIAAGTPVYADDHIEQYVNFNEYLIQNPKTSFCIRVEDHSMIGAGIDENDILVVDQAIEPTDGKIIVAALNGELLVKRLKLRKTLQLVSENPAYSPIKITKDMDFKMLGVAVYVIHSL